MPQAQQQKQQNDQMKLPIQTRSAELGASKQEARTVDMVWSTGARVRRYDWYREREYWEELSLDDGAVRLGRLNDGAPLLQSHNAYDLRSVLGVIERAELKDGQGTGSARFSKRAEVEPYFQDVVDGVIRHVSVGYRVHRIEMVPPVAEGDLWIYRAVDWEPYEVSLVSIPADAGAGIRSDPATQKDSQRLFDCQVFTRSAVADTPNSFDNPSKGNDMPQAQTQNEQRADSNSTSNTGGANPSTTQTSPVDQEAIRQAAIAEERTRGNEIRNCVRLANLPNDFAEQLVNSGTSLDQARAEVFKKLDDQSRANPIRTAADIRITQDEVDVRRAAMENSILHRIDSRNTTLTDPAREYRHMDLLRMAEECLQNAGQRVRGMSKMDIAGRAMHSTSDFPSILANVMNKRLRAAYEQAEPSFMRWANRAPNAPDFKQLSVTQLSGAPDLLQVGESGEVQFGTMSDAKEVYSVLTYARALAVTRQTIINDDLRAFDRLITAFNAAARRLENRLVYGQLTGNPLMADGVNLFHADRNNLATAAAISVDSLSKGRALMRKQTGLSGELLNLAPSYLIVPAALEQLAYQYTSSQYVPAKASDTNEFRAGGRTSLEPIVEPLLDATSATGWYLAANAGQVDTVEYCYLDGNEGVYLETGMDFDVEGMKIKARLDFATKAIDHRGLVKNPGA